VPFTTSNFSKQPVAIRSYSSQTDSFVYLLNDSPWPTKVRVRLDASVGCQFSVLADSPRRGLGIHRIEPERRVLRREPTVYERAPSDDLRDRAFGE
jgi:hypothetical protein